MTFVMITGCQTHQESSKPGTIKEINIDKMVEKFDNEDTFVVMITQTDCGYCKDFHELLDNWLPTHNLTIYEVNLDHEENATPLMTIWQGYVLIFQILNIRLLYIM